MLEGRWSQTEGGLGLEENVELPALRECPTASSRFRAQNELKCEEKVKYVQNSLFLEI